ncbi:small nuclear ribonucleoprotein SmD2 [Trypanosoma brucei gambiense DAL972]|uniref:Small nuclear ribonucleoprotein Sm D2 n=3 Tax=Trypanosoma brucei TaxID=5691 RepID=C9ZJS5_TRYB9|nr:small nuclear ribonucleoprotein SmD2 [Trypanosoma brucei gambiense DAL972]AAG00462.1 Sm-D2 [Trypanosoma brucei]RHW74129.1 small nuclear ribonucleoprotein SmD2 [Trypanosoma brucei equiperdum]CBH09635.1 small nuclear ribonucleoprotein SmD2 [Trypanosoma brucei gambiense DAL972]|eukprot:XP_011771939.1 small nuclear ribonucleoprotein SmD2 [Trypanosoma brucei gambiense DAL972]
MSGEEPTKLQRTESGARVIKTKEFLRTSVAEGPFCLLDSAVKNGTRVFIQSRYNKSLVATVVAFDKHFNLVLRDAVELTMVNNEQKERSIRNMFLRGASVVFIVRLPQSAV